MLCINNDVWDLVISVGVMVMMVVVVCVVVIRVDNLLIDDLFVELLVRVVGIDFFICWVVGNIKVIDVDDFDGMWGL